PCLCVYEGRHYSLGESWMEDGCLQCTFHTPVINVVHRPVDFPAWCEVRVDALACKVTLVQSADPRLPCLPGNGHNLGPSHSSRDNNYLQMVE
uniref:Uncharacterized protein n=1 Tax=Oncorhynchus mykiss TaxID=8022 RepID=A0A8C7PQD9_ONCMY